MILSIKFLIKTTSGNITLEVALNSLFRSLPEAPHLELPKMTPSGLSIGITLNIKYFLNFLALSSLDSRNYKIPLQAYDETDYPG